VVNTERTRPITAQLGVEGISVRSGTVHEIAADPSFEVWEACADTLAPVQRDLPPDGWWTFPPASVSAVELLVGEA
jgi:hypothetical protein